MCFVLGRRTASLHIRKITFLAAGSDHGAHGVVVSHPLRMRKALCSNPSVSISRAGLPSCSCGDNARSLCLATHDLRLSTTEVVVTTASATSSRCCADKQQGSVLAAGSYHGAHGVVVSHPLRMRKALGSNPSVSISRAGLPSCSCQDKARKPLSCYS